LGAFLSTPCLPIRPDFDVRATDRNDDKLGFGSLLTRSRAVFWFNKPATVPTDKLHASIAPMNSRATKPATTRSGDLFRARLDQIINLKHELAQLTGQIDWDFIDGEIAPLYSEKGRPGIPTRFAIGLLLLNTFTGCRTKACASAGL
jgi:hypothetical protein